MHACSQPVLRTGTWDMEKNCNESRLGRFEYLLHGGKKPRMNRAFMIALVVVVLLSFVGVVSADDYYNGTPPETELQGVVNGDIEIQWANTWNQTPVTDWSKQQTWANFTSLNIPENAESIEFVKLYVVPYCGSMSADYFGNMTVVAYQDNTRILPIVINQSLDRSYIRIEGTNYSAVPYGGYLVNLSRVTSDYIAIFETTDALEEWGNGHINVSLTSYNLTGRFDGRFKSAFLVYGWNVTSGSSTTTRYWINDGNDPSTYYDDDYVGQSAFTSVPTSNLASATLYTVDVASANGVYTWNGSSITPTTLGTNSYARLNQFTLGTGSISSSNLFTYDRSGNYYKIAVAMLKNTYSS